MPANFEEEKTVPAWLKNMVWQIFVPRGRSCATACRAFGGLNGTSRCTLGEIRADCEDLGLCRDAGVCNAAKSRSFCALWCAQNDLLSRQLKCQTTALPGAGYWRVPSHRFQAASLMRPLRPPSASPKKKQPENDTPESPGSRSVSLASVGPGLELRQQPSRCQPR
jgi:hypothetical protein